MQNIQTNTHDGKICKLVNFPKVEFYIILFGLIWDPHNELKTKMLLLFKMSGFTHDRVILYFINMVLRSLTWSCAP